MSKVGRKWVKCEENERERVKLEKMERNEYGKWEEKSEIGEYGRESGKWEEIKKEKEELKETW